MPSIYQVDLLLLEIRNKSCTMCKVAYGNILFLLVLFTCKEQVPLEVKSLEIFSETIPIEYVFATQYPVSRSQFVYLTDELGGAMMIKKVAFYSASLYSIPMKNFSIRMKNTMNAPFYHHQFDNTDLTTCLTTTFTVEGVGWHIIPLTQPFAYNGRDHLLIDISFQNAVTDWQNAVCSGFYSPLERGLVQVGEVANPQAFTTGYIVMNLPNIRLYVTD
jgi:hypothetical protein